MAQETTTGQAVPQVTDAANVATTNAATVANTASQAVSATTDSVATTTGAGHAAIQTAVSNDGVYQRFVDFMNLGGPVVWILLVFSIIAVSLFIMKIVQFIQEQPEAKKHLPAVVGHWEKGEVKDALRRLDSKRPVDDLIITYIQGKQSGMPMDKLQQEVERLAAVRLNRLTAYLRPLEVIATLSPLLGLLGTVMGMIEAFQHMQSAGAQVDPSVLSGGIWKALLTTAVGLVVAIPVMVMFNWLERKVERVGDLMNDAITRMFTSTPNK